MTSALFNVGIQRSAVISPDGLYRYRLDRWWAPESVGMGSTRMPYIMLNPSTADADVDDPTIRRCIGFARREGFHGITVVNLFAYRATDPDDLRDSEDAGIRVFGPENKSHIIDVAETAGQIVAAWGAHPFARRQAALVLGHLRREGIPVLCLGTTKDGSPRHPLYVKADQPLIPFGAS